MRVLALLPLLLALLAGCSAGARTAPSTIRLRASVFYSELQHYDRAIAALRATESAWSEDERAHAIDRDRIALAHVDDEASRSLGAIARESSTDRARETAALRSASALVHTASPSNAFASYRGALLASERSEVAQAIEDERTRTAAAIAQRQEQLLESESNLAWKLTRRDAVHAMLLNLRGDRAQLAALQSHEDAEISALQAHDRGLLAAYRAQVNAESARRTASTIAQIERRTQANLSVRASAGSGGNLSDPTSALDGAAASLQGSLPASLGEAARLQDSLANAKGAVSARFAADEAADAGGAQALHAEILELERERRALYEAIAAAAAVREEVP